mmetsp:Transcript_42369/g.92432  ORF Transcript_42369/g.92432 Transcript_42369/m.92432 type:complete len:183 (+) Transcript_42369:62-610(+)|eukprot:CAMPEP_0204391772 /NCGR_PEP_ID=MMETSP0469-20131031/61419_1 /ASSEMBLY_ACC=CAM_ASM_000384 /TAXON_ID=2969 /ORGANISM="Oxyrrhis marina" /LENGTH=182 /DNA_ID=CAMNT_0051385733 /DNA_START=64 /DNA_END=612 /DNA_ORIENTATION=+
MRVLALSAMLTAVSAARAEVKPSGYLKVSDLQKTGAVAAVHKELADDACDDAEKLKGMISRGIDKLAEMRDLLAKEGGVMKHEEAEAKTAKPKAAAKAARSMKGEREALDYQAAEMALDMETIKAEVETLKDAKQNKDELCALFREASLELERIDDDEETMRLAEQAMEQVDSMVFAGEHPQ